MKKIKIPNYYKMLEIIENEHPCPECKSKHITHTSFDEFTFLCPDCGKIIEYNKTEAKKIVGNILLHKTITELIDNNKFNPKEWEKVIFI